MRLVNRRAGVRLPCRDRVRDGLEFHRDVQLLTGTRKNLQRQMGFDRSSRADALDLADLHTTRSVISTSEDQAGSCDCFSGMEERCQW